MNPDKQRIAIAEACGFRNIHESDGIWFGTAQDSKLEAVWPLPDYLHDLNAIASADNTLSYEAGSLDRYHSMLMLVVAKANDKLPMSQCRGTHRATAAQRAEAFLKTLGRWEDTP